MPREDNEDSSLLNPLSVGASAHEKSRLNSVKTYAMLWKKRNQAVLTFNNNFLIYPKSIFLEGEIFVSDFIHMSKLRIFIVVKSPSIL